MLPPKDYQSSAAYLLMPRERIIGHLTDNRIDREESRRLAGILHVNESALVEHLYNTHLIDEVERDHLRISVKLRH